MPSPAPANSLDTAASAITKGVGAITSLLNLAPGPTAVAGFVAEGIFKAIKLGVAIRAAQRAASARLDATIRAMDVLRTPIVVDLTNLELQSFYLNDANLDAFPGFSEFAPELQEFKNTGGNPKLETKRVLIAAKGIVPALQDDPDLSDHPELQSIFSIGLDPLKQSGRQLVMAYLVLFPDGQMPYQRHYDRLGDFWKNQLTIALGDIDQSVLDAQAGLDSAIRDLVINAIFDAQGGLLTSSLDLAKQLKRSSIDERIAALTKQKAKATDDAAKAKIQADIDKLTAFKTRLA